MRAQVQTLLLLVVANAVPDRRSAGVVRSAKAARTSAGRRADLSWDGGRSNDDDDDDDDDDERDGHRDVALIELKDDFIVPPRRRDLKPTFSARLLNVASGLTTNALQTSYSAMRDAKSFFSSDFESLLLEATRPTEDAPDPTAVERVVATVGTFVRNLDLRDATNPYRVTLRKLWAKLAEKDARTTLKALFLLHTLLASVEPEDGAILRAMIQKMAKETCKRTRCKYFDPAAILDCGQGGGGGGGSGTGSFIFDSGDAEDGGGPDFDDDFDDGPLGGMHQQRQRATWGFLQPYQRYVLRRAAYFTSSFEEMALLCDGSPLSADEIVGQLLKAKKLLGQLLACGVDADGESEAALCCLDLLVRDAAVLFRFYDERLDWCLRRRAKLFADWDDQEADLALEAFVQHRTQVLPLLQRFLRTSGQVLQLYGYAPPAVADLGIGGGGGASGDDDDEDAEEDDEEGEDEGDGYDDDDGYEYDEEA
jgi:hypothetical protein